MKERNRYRSQLVPWPQFLYTTKSKRWRENPKLCVAQRTMYWKCEIKCRFFLRSRKECVFVFVFIACSCVCVCVLLTFFVSPVLSVYSSHFLREHKTTYKVKRGSVYCNYTMCVLGSLVTRTHILSHSIFYSSLFISGSVSLAPIRSTWNTHRHMNCAISCSLVTYAWTGCAHCVYAPYSV